MKCEKCGATLPDDVKFCTSCGAPTALDLAEEVEVEAPKKKPLGGIEFVPTVQVGGILGFILKQRAKKKDRNR